MLIKINNPKTITERIGVVFDKELREIREERLKLKKDKKKRSTRVLTNLIVEHKAWKKIKEDMINLNLEVKNGK